MVWEDYTSRKPINTNKQIPLPQGGFFYGFMDTDKRLIIGQYAQEMNHLRAVIEEPVEDPSPSDEFDKFIDPSWGIRVTVPRTYLNGTQPIHQYEKRKEHNVKRQLARFGRKFLEEHPISATAVPTQEGVALYVWNGHHRARYSGIQRIDDIPTRVYTLEQTTEIFNRAEHRGYPYTPESLEQDLQNCNSAAADSFGRRPHVHDAQTRLSIIEGVHTLEQLQQRFPREGTIYEAPSRKENVVHAVTIAIH